MEFKKDEDFEKWFTGFLTREALSDIDREGLPYGTFIKKISQYAFEAGKYLLMNGVPLKCAACEYLNTPRHASCMRGSGFDAFCIHNEIKDEERGLKLQPTNGCTAPVAFATSDPNGGTN